MNAGPEQGYYFWHPLLNQAVRNLPDLTFVEVTAERGVHLGYPSQRSHFLYVRQSGFKWWAGHLFELDAQELIRMHGLLVVDVAFN